MLRPSPHARIDASMACFRFEYINWWFHLQIYSTMTHIFLSITSTIYLSGNFCWLEWFVHCRARSIAPTVDAPCQDRRFHGMLQVWSSYTSKVGDIWLWVGVLRASSALAVPLPERSRECVVPWRVSLESPTNKHTSIRFWWTKMTSQTFWNIASLTEWCGYFRRKVVLWSMCVLRPTPHQRIDASIASIRFEYIK